MVVYERSGHRALSFESSACGIFRLHGPKILYNTVLGFTKYFRLSITVEPRISMMIAKPILKDGLFKMKIASLA